MNLSNQRLPLRRRSRFMAGHLARRYRYPIALLATGAVLLAVALAGVALRRAVTAVGGPTADQAESPR